jgi:hypothetical protein
MNVSDNRLFYRNIFDNYEVFIKRVHSRHPSATLISDLHKHGIDAPESLFVIERPIEQQSAGDIKLRP